jgi:DnaJ-domain-containing protein 1
VNLKASADNIRSSEILVWLGFLSGLGMFGIIFGLVLGILIDQIIYGEGFWNSNDLRLRNYAKKTRDFTPGQTSNQYAKLRSDLELLGLNESADLNEVKKTYRQLARQFHPDTTAVLDPTQQQQSETAIKRISDAYERILKNYSKR